MKKIYNDIIIKWNTRLVILKYKIDYFQVR